MRRDKDRPVYMISVVAEMLRVHPQTLRMYEREGLLRPSRAGGQRVYSEADVERLGFILELTRGMGVNKAGVEIILRMRQRMEALQREVQGLMDDLDSGMRRRFEDRLRRIFSEEDQAG